MIKRKQEKEVTNLQWGTGGELVQVIIRCNEDFTMKVTYEEVLKKERMIGT